MTLEISSQVNSRGRYGLELLRKGVTLFKVTGTKFRDDRQIHSRVILKKHEEMAYPLRRRGLISTSACRSAPAGRQDGPGTLHRQTTRTRDVSTVVASGGGSLASCRPARSKDARCPCLGDRRSCSERTHPTPARRVYTGATLRPEHHGVAAAAVPEWLRERVCQY